MQGFFSASTLAQAKAPDARVPRCGACGLYRDCNTPKMPVAGQGERQILIVGDFPNGSDDNLGRWLTGVHGKYVRDILNQLGVDVWRDCWVTSALICHPGEFPEKSKYEDCAPNLFKTIETLKPVTIICLGSDATLSITNRIWKKEGMEDGGRRFYGYVIPSQKINAWVCPMMHPRDIASHDDRLIGVAARLFQRHLAEALKKKKHPWVEVPDNNREIERIVSPTDAGAAIHEMLKECEHGGQLAFDYETNCLKPDSDEARIVSCSLCLNGERTIAYPWTSITSAATDLILQHKIPKIASNLKFEDRWTQAEFGRGVRRWEWDTMISAHVENYRPGITSIKFQAFVKLGVPSWSDHIEPYLKSGKSSKVNRILKEIAISDLLLYNGLDSLFEYRVAMIQQKLAGSTN